MRKNQISTHSFDSFKESETVGYLKTVLESTHTIKTFFGENDKTPNHDGFFELVDNESIPKKQFIVQIKKTKKLNKCKNGKNKGKYVYELKTNFLAYIKEKVTENPAIYFVVDIDEKRIFWIYLSDEILMQMDFEGRKRISYAFSDNDILDNINKFTEILNNIAQQRNKVFLHKTKEEIIEIQEAADYINQLLNHDFVSIKNSVFPNLWRFGIKCTKSPDISIGINGQMQTIPVSTAVALYPQIKGFQDTGIQEYTINNTNIFNHFSIGAETDLSKYSKDSLHKIIIEFFENKIPPQYLPDLILFELIDVFIQKSEPFFDSTNCLTINLQEVLRRLLLLAKYTQYIIDEKNLKPAEISEKTILSNWYKCGARQFYDIATHSYNQELLNAFTSFTRTFDNNNFEVNKKIFSILKPEYYYYLNVIIELKKRKLDNLSSVWKYNWIEVCKLPVENFSVTMSDIVKKWISNLPTLYEETYNKVFDTNKYKVKNSYVFKIEPYVQGENFIEPLYTCKIYHNDKFILFYNDSITSDWNQEENNLEKASHGLGIDEIFKSKTPLFYSVSCLLYQGICDNLGFKLEGLNIGKNNLKRIYFF